MGMQGEKCASNKTDVWGGSLTMTKILAGDDAIKSAIKYVSFVCLLSSYCDLAVIRINGCHSSLMNSLIPSVYAVVNMFLILLKLGALLRR